MEIIKNGITKMKTLLLIKIKTYNKKTWKTKKHYRN